jgi:ferritin heavy chain
LQSTFFDRDDQALPGFSKYFRKASDEERDHACKLIQYQNMRGGKVVFQDIDKPTKSEWSSPLEAIEDALELEKTVNQSLLDLHKAADGATDPQMTDFIEGEYLKEQVEAIKELGDLVTKVKRVGNGLGIYIIDKDLE